MDGPQSATGLQRNRTRLPYRITVHRDEGQEPGRLFSARSSIWNYDYPSERRDMNDNEEGERMRGWQRRDPGDLLAAMDPAKNYRTGELAEAVDWPHRTTLYVLNRLARQGQVQKRKIGPKRAVWTLTDDSKDE